MPSSVIHKVLQGSFKNRIELTVENTSSHTTKWVKVEARNPPSWLRFERQSVTIHEIQPHGEATAFFTFDVDSTVPVDMEHAVIFDIRSESGEKWKKEIHIVIVRSSIVGKLINRLRASILKGQAFEKHENLS